VLTELVRLRGTPLFSQGVLRQIYICPKLWLKAEEDAGLLGPDLVGARDLHHDGSQWSIGFLDARDLHGKQFVMSA
jgi:hypothetical protein